MGGLRDDGMTAPVLCISGYPLSDTPEVLAAKPFTPEQLLAIVETALEESE